MKRIGLCIVYKNWNYGSILQSYATLLKLQELGIDYEIIRYERRKNINYLVTSFVRLFNRDMLYSKLRKLRHSIGKKMHKDFLLNDRIRSNIFKKFVNENFGKFSVVIHRFKELSEYAEQFDAVLVGSDQLWLPSGLATNFFNLMFVPDKVKKVAYSTSFGVKEIPFYQKRRTIKYLNRIEYISVREHSGQAIVKRLTGREVPVILDPTMIISKELWDRSIPCRRIIDEDYIFCYFLGNNVKQRKETEKLSKNTGLKIVTLRHMDEYIKKDEDFGDYAPYDIGPAEFVNLIRYASYVCTDSFHGTVFSIIYHKQFISFNRYNSGKNSRNSRLDTLFLQLGINRRFKNNIVEEIEKPIDYDKIEKNIKELRDKSSEYLVGAIWEN